METTSGTNSALDTQALPHVRAVRVEPSSGRRVHVVLHLDVAPGTAPAVADALRGLLTPDAVNVALARHFADTITDAANDAQEPSR